MQTLTIKQARAEAARNGEILSAVANLYHDATGNNIFIQTKDGPRVVADRLADAVQMASRGQRYKDADAPQEWPHRYGVAL